jgi:hypothetical protein
MNWEAIGAIGEILGAIAVLITLVYLAVQIRQNTRQLHANEKAMHRNEMNALMQNWSDLRRVEMSDSSLAEILARAETDFSGLTDAERIRYLARWTEIMWINHHLWQRVQAGIFGGREWERGRRAVLANLHAPGGLVQWQRRKHQFDSGFVREIDDELEKPTDEG